MTGPVEKLKVNTFEKLPSVENVLVQLHEDDCKTIYQGVELTVYQPHRGC